jgi:hypothetical protein
MTQSPSNVFAVCRLCNVLCAAPALLCFHSSLFRGGHARIVLVAAEREASQRGRTAARMQPLVRQRTRLVEPAFAALRVTK